MQSVRDFYSFERDPFDARPGRGPVLGTRALREALSWVASHLEGDHSLLCVGGAEGAGRSSLARVLPGRLAGACRVARLVDPTRSWTELRLTIAHQLFLDAALSRDALVGARSQGDRMVILVDAAERASHELLKQLDELLAMRGPAWEQLVQIVLLARESAGARDPVWRWIEERRVPVHRLEPIEPDEIHGYIRKRLESAGRRPGDLFSEAAALVIHRHSAGNPRRVNLVCDAALQAAARLGARRVDARLVDDSMGSTGR